MSVGITGESCIKDRRYYSARYIGYKHQPYNNVI